MYNDSKITLLEREQEANRRNERQNIEELRKLQATYQSDLRKLDEKFSRETRESEDKHKNIVHRISETEYRITSRREELQKEYNNSLKK